MKRGFPTFHKTPWKIVHADNLPVFPESVFSAELGENKMEANDYYFITYFFFVFATLNYLIILLFFYNILLCFNLWTLCCVLFDNARINIS